MYHNNSDKLCRGAAQEDCQAGRSGIFGDVDDFLETRHTECYVLRRHTGVVERVESHLRGRLAQTLRRQRADHLAGLYLQISIIIHLITNQLMHFSKR